MAHVEVRTQGTVSEQSLGLGQTGGNCNRRKRGNRGLRPPGSAFAVHPGAVDSGQFWSVAGRAWRWAASAERPPRRFTSHGAQSGCRYSARPESAELRSFLGPLAATCWHIRWWRLLRDGFRSVERPHLAETCRRSDRRICAFRFRNHLAGRDDWQLATGGGLWTRAVLFR